MHELNRKRAWVLSATALEFLGSISGVFRVRSLILPEERGMSAGSFSRTAAGNRVY